MDKGQGIIFDSDTIKDNNIQDNSTVQENITNTQEMNLLLNQTITNNLNTTHVNQSEFNTFQSIPIGNVSSNLSDTSIVEQPINTQNNLQSSIDMTQNINNTNLNKIDEKLADKNMLVNVMQPTNSINNVVNDNINTQKIINNTDLVKDENFIVFENVNKTYINGETKVVALDDVSFKITRGELVVMLGASGAGKSTALNALGGMDTISAGKIIIDGVEISKKSLNELTEYRRNDIGFVFQFYNLIQNLTAIENVELVTEICKNPLDPAEILTKVGLGHRLNNFPSQLSGGEQQRTSIARALSKNPKILLCDEPTGALDYRIGKQILQLLEDTCKKNGITVIIITHNSLIAPIADKVINFRSGNITSIEINEHPTPVGDIEW